MTLSLCKYREVGKNRCSLQKKTISSVDRTICKYVGAFLFLRFFSNFPYMYVLLTVVGNVSFIIYVVQYHNLSHEHIFQNSVSHGERHEFNYLDNVVL